MDEHTESGPCKEDELVGFHQQAKSESLDQVRSYCEQKY